MLLVLSSTVGPTEVAQSVSRVGRVWPVILTFRGMRIRPITREVRLMVTLMLELAGMTPVCWSRVTCEILLYCSSMGRMVN